MSDEAGCAKAWVVISRPDRLPLAIAAAQGLRAQFPGGVHLLREQSRWWECAEWQPYASQFAEVHAFPRVETCRGLRDLPRLFREAAERRRRIGALPIEARRDVIFCLGGFLTISNAASSAHSAAKKILCVSAKAFRELHRQSDRTRYRFTTSGWLQNRLVEPMAGLNRTLHFKPRLNTGGDGVRLERLQQTPEEIYDAIVVMSNTGAEVADDRARKIVSARFPSIAGLRDLPPASGPPGKRKRVIFFGTPFLLIHNLEPLLYVAHLDRCFAYLRAHCSKHDLIYRPHPVETNEAQQLDLRDFRIEDDREAAELYFLRNFSSIAAVFSVSSTVSRTAFNNGLNAYAMYPMFPFNKQQAEFFKEVMGEVPGEFAIRDFNSPPVPYQPAPSVSGRTFAEGLVAAAAAVYASHPERSAAESKDPVA